jgi:serine/threonine-protein kinase HipA
MSQYPMENDPIFRLYEGLSRAGPGSDRSTLEALDRCAGALRSHPRVLDLGCGPGPQTLVLAERLARPVLAVDIHQPFLDRLEATAKVRGLDQRIKTLCADMGNLDLEPGGFDLIWSEGAIYFLEFEAGLRLWRDFLAPDGIMVVSECSWLTDDRPSEVETFWRDAYPTMGSVAENRARAISAGFDLFDSFVLPASDWWDNYYTPLLARLAELRSEADAGLRAVIEDTEREIDLYRRYGDTYGYVFYLMAPVQ